MFECCRYFVTLEHFQIEECFLDFAQFCSTLLSLAPLLFFLGVPHTTVGADLACPLPIKSNLKNSQSHCRLVEFESIKKLNGDTTYHTYVCKSTVGKISN